MSIQRKYKLLAAIAPAVLLLDQLTKAYISKNFAFGTRLQVFPGFFDIVHFRNEGAAFGMLAGLDDSLRVPFFYVVAVVAVVVLALYFRSLKRDELGLQVAISLVFGGIAGNILDRLRIGSVVDFLSFHIGDKVLKFELMGKMREVALEWPAFNVADSAITVAMFILIFEVYFRRKV